MIAGGTALLAFLTLQRGAELVIATRHTRALFARGAYEVGASHYPVMVALHATWLATLWVFGWNRPLQLWFVLFFVVLQCGRVWVLRTLGERCATPELSRRRVRDSVRAARARARMARCAFRLRESRDVVVAHPV
jgi:methyltransferase